MIGKAHMQYVLTPSLRLSFRVGFGWLGYTNVKAPFVLQGASDSTRIEQLDILAPATASLLYTRNLSPKWKVFAGGGAGLYYVDLQNNHHTIYDPVTHERYKFVSTGVTGEAGLEYFLHHPNVSFEWLGSINHLFDANTEKFPSGYAGRYGFFDFSFGVNVYFGTSGAPPMPKEPAGSKPAAAPAPSAAPSDTVSTTPPGNP